MWLRAAIHNSRKPILLPHLNGSNVAVNPVLDASFRRAAADCMELLAEAGGCPHTCYRLQRTCYMLAAQRCP